jgi:hypothetical protein
LVCPHLWILSLHETGGALGQRSTVKGTTFDSEPPDNGEPLCGSSDRVAKCHYLSPLP